MASASSLIPELDDIVKHGSAERRADAVARISDLFLQDAARFETQHVALFDDILSGLVPRTEIETRMELAERLSRLDNAPPTLMKQLAREDEIKIAGPILSRSPLIDEPTLIDIARAKGQDHLAAISERPSLSPPVTDVIVRRGDRDVVRSVAANAGAQFSEHGYSNLVNRAVDDGTLALTVGQREDIPPATLKRLLVKSVETIRRRLLDIAKPKQKAAINKAMKEISDSAGAQPVVRDFGPAQRAILALRQAGELNEVALLKFAREQKYEEAVAALAALSGMRLATVHQLVQGDRYDPVLLLGKSTGLEWATIRALVILRLGGRMPSGPDVEEARLNYERLSPATAQRVLAFWRMRDKVKQPA
jgi:uncharacterized protein (DUF2336 family)